MRVLEVVGGEESREILWRHLLRTALLRAYPFGAWMGSCGPDFQRHIRYTERDDWAHSDASADKPGYRSLA